MATKTTRILWVSENPTMSAEQLTDLLRIFHNNISVKAYTESLDDLLQIISAGADCDVWAVDLPAEMLVKLMKEVHNPVIRSKRRLMERHGVFVDGITGVPSRSKTELVHDGWERIIKFDIVVETL